MVCELGEFGKDGVEYCRNVARERKIAGVNATILLFEFGKVMLEGFLVHILMHGSELLIWRESGSSRIRAVKIDNLMGLLVMKRIDIMHG